MSLIKIGPLTVIFHLMALINFYQYYVYLFTCLGENQYSESVILLTGANENLSIFLQISYIFIKFGS